MAGSVLAELYVDVVARGVEETARRLRSLTQASQEAARQMTAVGRAGADAMNRVSTPTRTAAADMTRLGGGAGQAGGGLAKLGGQAVIAGAAMAGVAAAIGLITSGFSGTTEIEMFGNAVMQIAREAASLFAPALRLATDLLNQLTAVFRSTGTAGQFFATGLGLLTPVITVLSDPGFAAAMRGLVTAFGQMVQAGQPLLNLLANLSLRFINTFVTRPLVLFVEVLTVIVQKLTEVAQLVSAGLGLAGLGRLLQAPNIGGGAGVRRQVTLNQTGTEDAQGTFQRIQQAILKSGVKEEKGVPEKQLEELQQIRIEVKTFFAVVGKLIDRGRQQAEKAPERLAEGAVAANPALGAGMMAGNLLGRLLGGR